MEQWLAIYANISEPYTFHVCEKVDLILFQTVILGCIDFWVSIILLLHDIP